MGLLAAEYMECLIKEVEMAKDKPQMIQELWGYTWACPFHALARASNPMITR